MEQNDLAAQGKAAEVAFGERVRELRQLMGITQAELAQRLTDSGFKTHHTAIARLEKGTRPTSVAEVMAIGAILGVSGEALFGTISKDFFRLMKAAAIQRRIDSLNRELDHLRAEAKALASAMTPDGITEEEWPGVAFEHSGRGDDGEHSEEA